MDGFAEAHVVSENTVEVVGGEGGHPFVPGLLVGSKGGLEAFRWCLGSGGFAFAKVLAEFFEGGRRGFELEGLGDLGGVEGVERGFGVEDDGEVVEDLAEAVDREVEGGTVGEVDEVAGVGGFGGELLKGVVLEKSEENGEKVELLSVDIEADGQGEPAAGSFVERGIEFATVDGVDVMGELGIDFDAPAGLLELGNGGSAEPRPEEVWGGVVGFGEEGVGFFGELTIGKVFGGEAEEEAERGLACDGGEADFGELFESPAFGSRIAGEVSLLREVGEWDTMFAVSGDGAGDEPGFAVGLAEGLEEEAGGFGRGRFGLEEELEGGFERVAGDDFGLEHRFGTRFLLGFWGGLKSRAPEDSSEGVGFASEKESRGGVGAVVGVVAGAEGVEVVGVAFGPEVDFDLEAFAGGGELVGLVLGLVEGKVGEERFFGEFLAEDEDVIVEAVVPGVGGEEGLEGVGQGGI